MKAKFLEADKTSVFSLVQNEETSEIMIALKNQLASTRKFETKEGALNFINGKKIPWELILNLIIMIVKEIIEEIKKKEQENKHSNGNPTDKGRENN